MVNKLWAISVILVFLATPAIAQSANRPTDASTRQLVRWMEKDKNGKVSREEFMSFMQAEFDRLDVNHNGELDPNKLGPWRIATVKHPGGTGSK